MSLVCGLGRCLCFMVIKPAYCALCKFLFTLVPPLRRIPPTSVRAPFPTFLPSAPLHLSSYSLFSQNLVSLHVIPHIFCIEVCPSHLSHTFFTCCNIPPISCLQGLLFARTNFMAEICADLIEMVEIVDDFFKFLGPELKAVTGEQIWGEKLCKVGKLQAASSHHLSWMRYMRHDLASQTPALLSCPTSQW